MTKRPRESAPTRLSQLTLKPRRARPMATLLSAPAMRLWKCPTRARSPVRSATNIAMVSPNERISISGMGSFLHGATQAGEGVHLFACNGQQVVALQRVFHGPGYTLTHLAQQTFPQFQVGGARWQGDELAVRALGHGFAVQVVDMPAEQARGAAGGLVLPVPVADIEGHFHWQLLLLDLIEKTQQGLDTSTLGGLVVLHQQAHR